jgi:hypothetical protein
MIVGVMALNRFPYWQEAVKDLLKYCDKVYFRFDGYNGDPEIPNQIEELCGDKLGVFFTTQGWQVPTWREDCLKLVAKDKPCVVLCPDQDEMFGKGFAKELGEFIASDKKAMMFKYDPLETSDGRVANDGIPYPLAPHMKVFKWEEGVSYFPYHGNATIARYVNSDCHWIAQARIKHLCCYTPAMEQMKHFRDNTKEKKAVKAVTLVGFGPSSKVEMEAHGEVWSLNNCYDALDPRAMELCTRIFEMHQLEKRQGPKDVGRDGKPHLWHLDQEGRKGRRIVLLKKDDQITNSETYPMAKIEAKTGMDNQWRGTPCYMLAMAIVEGFTDIRIYGLDQMDFEHTLQREAFLFWQGFALGRGIRLSGALTSLERNRHLGKYGLSYGPEMDAAQEKALWDGWPFEMHMKIPSRAVMGDLYQGDR